MAKRIDQLNGAQSLVSNEDVLPIYQPSAASPKTRKVTVGAIAALNSSAIAAAQAAAQAAETAADAAQVDATQALSDAADAQATADAAIPLSQKGAANGVATLDNSGKVPASQLTVVNTSFKGNWNATTNTPTLSDGTGTGGDFYFVQSGASRNLGSGSVAWTTGALIIHNGTVWVENEAVNTVISVAGKTGAVTLDQNDIASVTDKRTVTDNYLAALAGNDGTPSGLNKYVTESGLSTAIAGVGGGSVSVTGGNNLRIADAGDGVNTVGTGTGELLSALGYTNGTAATQFPLTASSWGGITANQVTYDLACAQESFLRLGLGTNRIRKLVGGDGTFVLAGHEIYIPSYKSGVSSNVDSQMFVFDGEGCRFRVTGSQSYALTMNIPDQTTALNSCIDNRWRFGNFKITGTGSNTGIRFGATRSPLIEQIEIDGFTMGWLSGFMLNAKYMNIATVNCTTGMKIDKGWWSGAGYSTSGNQPRFYNCRFMMVSTSAIGCNIIGTDTPAIRDCTIEGTNANYGIYIDNADSTVCKYALIDNLHVEMETAGDFAGAAVYYGGQSAFGIRMSNIYNQFGGTPNLTLLHMHSKVGVNKAWLSYCDNSENSDAWKLKNTTESGGNGSWDFYNVRLKGNPTTASQVYDPSNTLGIWTADSIIPGDTRVRLTPLLI